MERTKKIEKKNIQKNLSDNFLRLMPSFYEMESSFLSGVYKRYGDLEGGNIIIFFARDCHLEILRKREKDLDFDLSLERFWINHKDVFQSKKKIILVSEQTGLPKETTRRKIINLIKKRHLRKGEKNRLFWEPGFENKESYFKIIDEEINSLSKFIFEQSKLLYLNLPISKIEKEIKNNYCFYWYHYLNVQLEYIKFWQKKLKDLEMLLIALQVIIQTLTFLKRKDTDFQTMLSQNRNVKNLSRGINSDSKQIVRYNNNINKYLVELNKKYSIPVASIVFILIGAPLGVMARRGNFALSTTIGLGFFILYWAFLIAGENFADRGVMSPFLSMWLPNIVLGSLGVYLIYKNSKDTSRMKFEIFNLIFNRKKRSDGDKRI